MILAVPAAQKNGTSALNSPASADGLVVHEWGTFTSIAGKDGVAVDWKPLNGSSDLPGFVYDTSGLAAGTGLRSGQQCVKCNLDALVRMETPVIYFYADRETTVSVKVEFSQGKITEWYPYARLVYVPQPQDSNNNSQIDWGRITITPGAAENFPVEANPSHYYPARETDAAPLRVCGSKGVQQEKFLFYRGVGTFKPPIEAMLNSGKVTLKNISRQNIGAVIVFENRAGRIAYQAQGPLVGETVLDRPAANTKMDSLERELKSILVSQGLYEKEARAMINTWRDSWFEEGLRVFYIVPRKVTDSILPLTIEPRPSELKRVLVGRVEILTPELENEIRSQVSSLQGASIDDIKRAAAEINRKHGRFAEPLLNRLLTETTDVRLRERIQNIIEYAYDGGERR